MRASCLSVVVLVALLSVAACTLCLADGKVSQRNTNKLVSGKFFDRIFIILLENQPFSKCMENEDFRELTKRGTLLSNFFAVTHPSQPNYLALTSGDDWGVRDQNVDINATNIADLLEAKNISWKLYAEDYPENCFTDRVYGFYYRKHVPFISYDNIRNNLERCNKIVNANRLFYDIDNNNVPQYVFYTPNINNDGHNTGLAFSAIWTREFLKTASFTQGDLVVVTFDEDDHTEDNRIYTLLLGNMVRTGHVDETRYDLYSLLRTVEDNWDLGSLGRNDSLATGFAPSLFLNYK